MTSKCNQSFVSVLIFIALMMSARLHGEELPPIPVGLDAYRLWEQWPYQRMGARAYMRSTYDRSGGNEGADASHFLYQLADDYNVSLDVEGPGVLYFARYNHWHGSPWHYGVDGLDHLGQESSTLDPNHPKENSIFLPVQAFPNPLTWTWSITQGADLMWVPIGFERSFRMGYSRTRYGTGYYIYHQFVRGTKLSQPIRAWNEQNAPEASVISLLGWAGSDLVPQSNTPEGEKAGIKQTSGTVRLSAHSTIILAQLTNAPSMMRALEFFVPRDQAIAFGRTRLRVTWDDRNLPSIDAPVALFFGAGSLYNRNNKEFLVKAFPVFVRFEPSKVHLACFFPMPFFHSARLELVNPQEVDMNPIQWQARYAPLTISPRQVGYFHATYRDHPRPIPGEDLVLLDTRQTEGGGDWSGQLVGTSWIFSHRAVLNTLEGDPRFFFDDSLTPQAYGTGTEEWGGGGDYWGGQNMTLPFAGHPTVARNEKEAKNEEDKIESAYRFLLADLMPFGRNALIRLEHGGENQSTEHYETLTYWYGSPGAYLIKTDELHVGDPVDEKAHQYVSPTASAPYTLISRYEWGVDTLNGREIYPAHQDTGRKTTGASEFTLKLDPQNYGVLLRRKLDYGYPNQRAEVSIAPADGMPDTGAEPRWQSAGVWYLAGGNSCVYSNPREELGATQHQAQTSNRRFRDDEFLIPRDLTEGHRAIRVRLKFTPVPRPLYPGHPMPEAAWTEFRYTAYCFVVK